MSDWANRSREKIVDAACQMLAGSLSFIEGARQINKLRFDAGIADDRDILPFVGIDSETDAFPLDEPIRKLWSPKALDQLQPKIDQAERWAKKFGTPHCHQIIARYAPKNSN